MQQVLNLALPFFGMMLIGFAAAKFRPLPAEGLAWLNVFVIYVSLPALYFELLSRTPISQLANFGFIGATMAATAIAYAISFWIGLKTNAGAWPAAAIVGVAGGYGNIGYMGPGLTLAAIGPAATVPTALIFCFDNALVFALVPLLMAAASPGRRSAARTAREIATRIFLHPFILSSIAGVLSAATGLHPPVAVDRMLTTLMQAAAPCALFALGVTVALRPLTTLPREMPLVLFVKLVVHPALVLALLLLVGGIAPEWIETAVLMDSLPPALGAFVLAQQYGVYADRASATILVGTILSVVTVTIALVLVTGHMLPLTLFGR
eukprot:gene24718-32197_t